MTRIQEKKKAETEAMYRQYVGYSKMASRALMVLISMALYIGFTVWENQGAVSKAEESIAANMMAEVHGPLDYELYFTQCNEALDSLKYELPVIKKEMESSTFFLVSPIVFFAFTIMYWLFLKASRDSFRAFSAQSEGGGAAFMYPCLYNLPFRWLWLRVAWMGFWELFPMFVTAALLVVFILDREHFQQQVFVAAAAAWVPVILHYVLFGIRALGGANPSRLLWLIFFIFFSVSVFSQLTHGPLGYDPQFGILSIYWAVGVFIWIDCVTFGGPFLSIFLHLYPVLALDRAMKKFFLKRTKDAAFAVHPWVWPRAMLPAGYLAYFRDQYRELKRLEMP